MTHTHAGNINGTMGTGSTGNRKATNINSIENGINNESGNQEMDNLTTLDVDQQKDYVYKMHNYCCNPVQLKRKCDENYHKLALKRKELQYAKKKIKVLKNRVAFLKDVIKNLKQSGTELQSESKDL